MYMDFILKCNYGNTFEGIVAFNVALEQMKTSLKLPKYIYIPIKAIVYSWEFINNFLNDLILWNFVKQGIHTHFDLYNIGRLLGLIAKDVALVKITGLNKLIFFIWA